MPEEIIEIEPIESSKTVKVVSLETSETGSYTVTAGTKSTSSFNFVRICVDSDEDVVCNYGKMHRIYNISNEGVMSITFKKKVTKENVDITIDTNDELEIAKTVENIAEQQVELDKKI